MLKHRFLRAEMNKVYLGLGSNLGNSENNVKQAIHYFLWDTRFENLKYSSLYYTKPYGIEDQNDFLNCAISFETKIDLENIFKITKELEKRIGRVKGERWGPREIDIDILLFNDLITNDDKLNIPHSDLLNRDFVLVPLLEIDEELIDPVSQKKIKSFLSELKDKYIIDKINLSLEEIRKVSEAKS